MSDALMYVAALRRAHRRRAGEMANVIVAWPRARVVTVGESALQVRMLHCTPDLVTSSTVSSAPPVSASAWSTALTRA